MKRRILFLVGATVAVNCAVFGTYRLIFLWQFGQGTTDSVLTPFPQLLRVLLYGLRLDLALLGIEFSLIGFWMILRRRLRSGELLLWFWSLTGVHIVICASNIFAFAERNQSAGELLLPYLTSPYQVYLAVMPFCREHWLLMVALGVMAVFYSWLGLRVSRAAGGQSTDLWQSTKALIAAVGLSALPLLLFLEPSIAKKVGRSSSRTEFKLRGTQSMYYTNFAHWALNQAVVNPLFEFIRSQVPSYLTSTGRYHLSESDALETWGHASGRTSTDSHYPLMAMVHGMPGSSIENVVIIQIEGLSQWLVGYEENGRPVMPFLRRLSQEGIYFSNTFQNVNYTSGGVFSTATSVPKASYEEVGHRLTYYEMNGDYGTLSRILGPSPYTHYFCEGFRQSSDAFVAFMAHQGYETHGYGDFIKILQRKNQLALADTWLGISDGSFLQECAEILLQCPNRFTAHFMTCTTHSPWAVPSSFARAFKEPALNAFAYLDASIQAFVERMQSAPAVWDKTLLVVVADHTSVALSDSLVGRLRIPLIFYSPRLPRLGKTDSRWASQVDVVPTVLALLSGDHRYYGLGRNLLDPLSSRGGIVSGTTDTGYYLTDDYVLQYDPSHGRTRLFARTNDTVNVEDVSKQYPDVSRRLKREYFAQTELVKRLALSKQIFPFSADAPNRRAKGDFRNVVPISGSQSEK